MPENRPSWQIDPCPPWCQRGHEERDHPDDHVHRSASAAVPVIARRTWFEGGGIRRRAEPAELEVALSRVDGEREIWLYVGDGPARSLEVTVESAERLLVQLGVALSDASRATAPGGEAPRSR